MSDDIRTKAERALRLHNDAAPYIKAREQCKLLGELARYVLSEHPEDNGELIDGEWLYGNGWSDPYTEGCFEYDRRASFILCHNGHEFEVWCVATPLAVIKTRGELRRLLAALGVE